MVANLKGIQIMVTSNPSICIVETFFTPTVSLIKIIPFNFVKVPWSFAKHHHMATLSRLLTK